MPDVLNLALTDHTLVANKIDLLQGRWKLLRGTWQPGPFISPTEKVEEVLRLRATGTMTEIAEGEEQIHSYLQYAERWHSDPLSEYGIWLEWSVDGEPGAGTYAAKRAFISGGALQLAMPEAGRGAFAHPEVLANLALTRYPSWENVTSEQATGAAVSWLGGQVSLISELAHSGTQAGRLKQVEWHGDDQSQMWMGIRPRYSGITDFVSLWECELGNDFTDTADAADATASAGDKKQCTFATHADMHPRMIIYLHDVCAGTLAHNVGAYTVLLRAKTTAAGTTCYLKLNSGQGTAINFQQTEGPLVTVASAAWYLYEMGQIQIPSHTYRYENTALHELGEFALQIQAERVAGAGSLDLDCLILVPAWGSLFVDNQIFTGAGIEIYGLVYPDDSNGVFSHDPPASAMQLTDWAMSNWCMPRDPGVMVIAGHASTGSVLTDDADVTIDWIPRWRLYRAS